MARHTQIGEPVLRILVICGLLSGGACFGQPVITNVTDSAGYGPRVAPGSLASIFGTSLAGSTAPAPSLPLQTTLASVSVDVDGVPAPLLYVSPTQINFQVPSATAAGQTTLVVNAPAGTSASFTFTVTAEAPSIFQYGSVADGNPNHAAALNLTGGVNSHSAPVASGSYIMVYLTGIGAVSPTVSDGAAAPSSPLSKATATYSATIGGQTATISFLGLAPGYAGLAQANIQVPTLRTGDYPLVLTVGTYVSISAVVSVSGTGTAYTSPLTLVGTVPFSNTGASSVALLSTTTNSYAYVCGANQIEVVDVTSATAPATLGYFGNGSGALNGYGTVCAINTNIGFGDPYLVDVVGPLVDANLQPLDVSLAVFDLVNPASPVFVGLFTTGYPYIVNLSFYQNYMFASTSYFTFQTSNDDIVAQTGEYLAISFASLTSPQLVALLSPASLSDLTLKPASAVVGATGYAFIAGSTATGSSTLGTGVLDVINILTPTSISLANFVSVPQAAILLSFDISGNTLLVAGNTTGNRNPGTPDFGFTGNLTLTTMDLGSSGGTVVNPSVLQSIATGLQVNGTFHTAGFTNGVFVIVNNAPVTDFTGPQSLMVVDARVPSSMVLYPFQSQFGFGGMVTSSGGYLLAATSLGLNIYQLTLP